jgi:hypothetical protein
VEYKIGGTVARTFVQTKPNAATLVANNPYLPDAPTPIIHDQKKPNNDAIFMWNLRMNGAREGAMSHWHPAGRTRWRPGKRFLLN